MTLQVRAVLDFTCYIHPRLALLNVKLKRLTVVLNPIHNPSSDKKQCELFQRQLSDDESGSSRRVTWGSG